jgi:hypothetical protein
MPEMYTFNKGKWVRRKKKLAKEVITRLYAVYPSEVERFYLRMLLLNRKEATSYRDLKTIEGVEY